MEHAPTIGALCGGRLAKAKGVRYGPPSGTTAGGGVADCKNELEVVLIASMCFPAQLDGLLVHSVAYVRFRGLLRSILSRRGGRAVEDLTPVTGSSWPGSTASHASVRLKSSRLFGLPSSPAQAHACVSLTSLLKVSVSTRGSGSLRASASMLSRRSSVRCCARRAGGVFRCGWPAAARSVPLLLPYPLLDLPALLHDPRLLLCAGIVGRQLGHVGLGRIPPAQAASARASTPEPAATRATPTLGKAAHPPFVLPSFRWVIGGACRAHVGRM